MNNVIPENSRYIPFTQQKSCCVPTCLQIIMYKHNIPLIAAEKIGYHLGLVVHPDNKGLFYNTRTSKTPPASGYGTQITKSEYEPTKAFKKLGIPLKVKVIPANHFKTDNHLEKFLTDIENANKDVLLCFNHGVLIGDKRKSGGHVVIFDRITSKGIRIIDTSPNKPKWRNVSVSKMLTAMKKHGSKKSGGVWTITKT